MNKTTYLIISIIAMLFSTSVNYSMVSSPSAGSRTHTGGYSSGFGGGIGSHK